ncbi:DUF1223 domain-containing protein [Chelativorans sp. YIM 93263]|uniref:DUF1223 domain-containing protein n=1 Tax=Chelativorans sp. YIM 93263 TaxID=2906648 RepID=UPI0023789A45|nr:DUF1223 domain-containing protein [Chelativorans sp. YIM 93263]
MIRSRKGFCALKGYQWLLFGMLLVAPPFSPDAFAEEGKTAGVVELFTSQGCSRCPPADEILSELAERKDMVVLAYHVSYWDYLGWKDEFATPENTARQRDYENVLNTSVYTPQAVINGGFSEVGSDREALLSLLETHAPLPVDVELSYKEKSLVIDVGSSSTVEPAADTHVVLVYYRPRQAVAIREGENAGREIVYRNIVTDFQTVGMWHGEPLRLELPMSQVKKKGGGCAVLLQSVGEPGNPGPILGAANREVETR